MSPREATRWALRLARTVRHLHALQVVARPAQSVLGHLVREMPGGLAPRLVERWSPASGALAAHADAERLRGAERLKRLPAGSRLRVFEEVYGLELGSDAGATNVLWHSREAVEPYPASVRARRIAVATRLGARGLGHELARAARAAALRPEVHLLGNHLLENGFGLACAGAAAVGPEANAWWREGKALLDWQLPLQFLADGGHVERSASYHLALLAALLETIELARASGRTVPDPWRQTASRALGWTAAVRAPDGTYPLFNDAALDAAPTIDGVLALGAALEIAPGVVARVLRQDGASIARLDSTGWVRIETEDGACLFVDAGPDADGWQPGHAHADGLTFELWTRGVRTVVDFGVSSYATDAAREETRATRSHNTLELRDVDSCEVWGAFRVGRRGRGSVVEVEVGTGHARVALEHDGYRWMPGSPRHARAFTLRAGRLEVRDEALRYEGPFVSRLRVAADANVRVAGGAILRETADRWYPRHGDPLPARLFEQAGRAPDVRGVSWTLEW